MSAILNAGRRRARHDKAITFGSIFVAIALVSTLVRAAIAGGKVFGDTPVPGADLARQFDNIGFAALLVAGALTGGVFVALASYLGGRAGLLPVWLSIVGYIVAVLQFASVLFFPFILLFLWVLATAIATISAFGHEEAPAPERPSSIRRSARTRSDRPIARASLHRDRVA